MPTALTTNQFIDRAQAVHGTRYDYSRVNYVGAKQKVIVLCPIHGEFAITPCNHTSYANGCKQCAVSNRTSSLELFMCKAILKHGNKYNYDKVVYVHNRTKIEITCPTHGTFYQTPDKHLQGYGCVFCSGYAVSTQGFIDRSKSIHGNTYDYSLVQFSSMKQKVSIICPVHGMFSQQTEVHLRGSGCPKCNVSPGAGNLRSMISKTPSRATTPTIFYIVTVIVDGTSYNKVGITTKTVQSRFKKFNFIEVFTYKTSLVEAFSIEQQMLTNLHNFKLPTRINFDGWTEIINTDVATIMNEYNKIRGDMTNG